MTDLHSPHSRRACGGIAPGGGGEDRRDARSHNDGGGIDTMLVEMRSLDWITRSLMSIETDCRLHEGKKIARGVCCCSFNNIESEKRIWSKGDSVVVAMRP